MTFEWIQESIRLLELPELEVVLRQDWGARQENHRAAIRRALVDAIDSQAIESQAAGSATRRALTDPERAGLLELARVPRASGRAISISHCADLGGFVLTSQVAAIGFDVEIEARIKPEIVRRVSTEEERARAPSEALLWGAKEATFKALDHGRGIVVSMIETQDWKEHRTSGSNSSSSSGVAIWSFSARLDAPGPGARGIVAREGRWLFALVKQD